MTFGRRLRSRFWRPRVEEEVDAELAFHVDMRTRELVARGMDPRAARDEAVKRFGDIRRVNAACRDIGRQRDRDMRRTEFMSELRQDVTFACRQLIKSPGFAAVGILTLALGIGATTAIFSAVHAVVLRPLPVPDVGRVFVVYSTWRQFDRGRMSAGNYVDAVANLPSFSSSTAVQYSSFNIGDREDAERVIGARTTAGFFDVFATAPARGRAYTADEDQPGREQVAVLSHRLWARRFGSDASIVGREIRLSGRAYEVIGVMPASFDYTAQSEELWVPIAFTPERRGMHDEHFLQVFARLKAGATREQAGAELERAAADVRERFPKENKERAFAVYPLTGEVVGDYDRRLFVLLGAVGFVLLIACGNVANLLLARGAARAGELGIRAALGAGHGRIVRQLLTESLVLAAAGAALGLAIAWWGIRALVAAAPPGVPRLEQAELDPVALAFAGALAVLCAVVFGLAPAVRAARTDVQAVLKEGGRSAGMGAVRDRLRSALIAAELALVLLLLVGAGLLIRSSLALQRVDPGFDPRGVLSVRLTLPPGEFSDPARIVHTFTQIAEAAGSIPGVQIAAVTNQVPMGAGGNSNGLIPEGRAFDVSNAIDSRFRVITPEYFQTMGIAILRGRGFTEADRRGGLKVMVISEALARAAFPDQDPLGKRIACCEAGPDGQGPDYKTVVGVARDVRSSGLGVDIYPEFYLPVPQAPDAAWDWGQRSMYVVARASMDPMAVVNPLRRAVAQIAPGVPLFDARTMEQRIGASLATARFNTLLLTILGAIGLVLAAVGIYGVIAYFVSRRTQEIGVRLALGATRRDVIGLVVRQAAWPAAIGIGAGVLLSVGAMRALSSQLFGVTASDPVTFAAVVLLLALVAVAASLVPAGRAASTDPTRALHTN